MESGQGDREEESAVDSESFEILTFDPLAELAAELALCYLYIEQNLGGFCDWCTCQLKYHAGEADAECEICGCYELHHTPQVILPIRNKECRPISVHVIARLDGKPPNVEAGESYWGFQTRKMDRTFTDRDRALAARAVLKELTE